MLRVTWEWIGIDAAALDVANTVAVENGREHDLLGGEEAYELWAEAASGAPWLDPADGAAVGASRQRVLELRGPLREVLYATAAGRPLPKHAVAALNAASRAAPQWAVLHGDGTLSSARSGPAVDRLLAVYARSAMEIAAAGSAQLRVCPAPSCGMFYRPRRRQQRWCSEPCGTRARFARHYRARREAAATD